MPAQDLYQYLSQFISRERILSLVLSKLYEGTLIPPIPLKVMCHLERVGRDCIVVLDKAVLLKTS
jgi:hypothetical protein